LISKKYTLKDELDSTETLKKNVERDPIMKSFFESENDKDFEIDIVDLKQKIKKLSISVQDFKIAEDYYEIVKEADQIKSDLKVFENQASNIRIAIRNIENSLNIVPDVPKKKILDLYQEAEIYINDLIKKKLDEVETFNKKIIANRNSRLLKEKHILDQHLQKIETAIAKLGSQKDSKLEYLNTRGALDEFTKLNELLSKYQIQLDNIEKFRKLISEYKNKADEIKKAFIEENISTNNYLKNQSDLIENNILIFKSLADQFYEHKRAGIEIKNNEGVNKQRFDIKAKIDDDKGDGVNDVKIFCFDWTLLKAKHNHKINFLFHDSRLLSEIDTRQVGTIFSVAYTNTLKDNLQYIISVNQNTLDQLKNEFSESRLLGIQIDLDYDKE